MSLLSRLRPDSFTLALAGTVVLATLLSLRGPAVPLFDAVTNAAIALLFFLHGARLSRGRPRGGDEPEMVSKDSQGRGATQRS